ncbi:hypothetical protein KPH14_003153 [Odynerus spinipes]|uniref:Uncharacterized protein n=1 Tax=Odynerus spinipes TaxID=1348599 RepID=A0AAD9RWX2_9HYME|nr:hypothetical protein KPH14_003153 [Odynerus spinipes]
MWIIAARKEIERYRIFDTPKLRENSSLLHDRDKHSSIRSFLAPHHNLFSRNDRESRNLAPEQKEKKRVLRNELFITRKS